MVSFNRAKFGDDILGRIFVPGAIFASVGIGGGFATGREIIEFGGRYGGLGWATGVAMFAVLGIAGFLVFEVARLFRLFDYRSLMEKLIGPFYWAFDVLYILLTFIIIGVLFSASGSILEGTLGLNYWAGLLIMIVLIGVVVFYGDTMVAKFNGIGTAFLLLGYIIFASLTISAHWDRIASVLTSGDHSLSPDVSIWHAVWTGILYGGLTLNLFASALFTVKRQRSRWDTLLSAFFLSALLTFAWFLTYLPLMGFYPDEAIFEAPVPWLAMLGDYGPILVAIYGILMGWTLVATAVGLLHATVNRVNQQLVDFGHAAMSSWQRAAAVVFVLVLAVGLASIGIIDLIAKGYTIGAYGIIAIFGIPLLVRGTYLVATRNVPEKSPPSDGDRISLTTESDTLSP